MSLETVLAKTFAVVGQPFVIELDLAPDAIPGAAPHVGLPQLGWVEALDGTPILDIKPVLG